MCAFWVVFLLEKIMYSHSDCKFKYLIAVFICINSLAFGVIKWLSCRTLLPPFKAKHASKLSSLQLNLLYFFRTFSVLSTLLRYFNTVFGLSVPENARSSRMKKHKQEENKLALEMPRQPCSGAWSNYKLTETLNPKLVRFTGEAQRGSFVKGVRRSLPPLAIRVLIK